MHLVKSELWKTDSHPTMFVVTTNSYINKSRALTMGRGAARQATKRIDGIEYEAAEIIMLHAWTNGLSKPIRYGFLPVRLPRLEEERYGFGIFQVKDHWENTAKLDIISTSADSLRVWANENSDVTIRMNYPGIGNGKLSKVDVASLIEALPDNVFIYHY